MLCNKRRKALGSLRQAVDVNTDSDEQGASEGARQAVDVSTDSDEQGTI